MGELGCPPWRLRLSPSADRSPYVLASAISDGWLAIVAPRDAIHASKRYEPRGERRWSVGYQQAHRQLLELCFGEVCHGLHVKKRW
jgi:hypothetical protein